MDAAEHSTWLHQYLHIMADQLHYRPRDTIHAESRTRRSDDRSVKWKKRLKVIDYNDFNAMTISNISFDIKSLQR